MFYNIILGSQVTGNESKVLNTISYFVFSSFSFFLFLADHSFRNSIHEDPQAAKDVAVPDDGHIATILAVNKHWQDMAYV